MEENSHNYLHPCLCWRKKSNIILGGNHNRRKIKKFKNFLKIREVKNVFIFHTVDLQGREEKVIVNVSNDYQHMPITMLKRFM